MISPKISQLQPPKHKSNSNHMSSTNRINTYQTQTKKSNDVKKLILEINQKLMQIRNPKQLQLASTDRVALDTNLLGLGKDNHKKKTKETRP